MKMVQRNRSAMLIWIVPFALAAALLWQSGALKQNAAMGYALLLGTLVLMAAAVDKRRKQAETEGGCPRFDSCTIPKTRFSDVAANEEAMDSLRDLVSFIR